MNRFERIFRDEIDGKEIGRINLDLYRAYRELRLQGFYLEEGGESEIECEALDTGEPPEIERFEYRMISGKIVSNDQRAIRLYSRYWLGDKGGYRKEDMSDNVIFDEYETRYVLERLGERSREPRYYEIYRLFRDSGYIVKTGYKYGGLFRVYELGYSKGERQHSKFIIIPKSRISSSDLQRVIRIAESVNKINLFPFSKTDRFYEETFVMRKDMIYGVYVFRESDTIWLDRIVEGASRVKRAPMIVVVDREGDVLKLLIKLFKIRDRYFIGVTRAKI
ncbi:MAG: hypothetical protein N3C61_01780 [Candidatus Micrarchaeota archaeon]|nr:hypothetical protein [Candidatus Micrarchaeota archaeon]